MTYVEGHAGIEGNEGADRLANFGAGLGPEEERDWFMAEEKYREKIKHALEDRQRNANGSHPQEAVVEVEAPTQDVRSDNQEESNTTVTLTVSKETKGSLDEEVCPLGTTGLEP